MTRLYCFIFFALLYFGASSQNWQDNIKDPTNFYSIKEAWLGHIKDDQKHNGEFASEIDDEELKFKRWEYFMEPRTYPTGKLPSADHLIKEIEKFKKNYSAKGVFANNASWFPLEPASGFPANGNAGRVNCIAFHPTDTNTMFIGTPNGGLWKTIDGGQTWIPKTDNLPNLGVSEIAINSQTPNVMYMATGDKDAANFYSNPYTLGLMKSTDGGTTWNNTSLQFLYSDQPTIQRVLIHPTQPNILLVSVGAVNGTPKGIWRSTDNGTTWNNVYGGSKYDMEFNPGNPNIVYASAYGYLLRSTDAGATWSTMTSTVFPSSGLTSAKIAVTPANPNVVYVQWLGNTGNTLGLYKSNNSGLTWTQQNTYALTTQGGYDWVLAVSPVDSNHVIYGGQFLYRSLNAGITTSGATAGYFDNHGMDYRPGSNVLFNSGDGGIYKSYNNGLNWINLNRTLQTFQYYRLGCSVTKPSMVLTGAQDNGTMKHFIPNWTKIGGGDGMECLVDYTDSTIYYTASQYGNITRYGSGLGAFTPPPTAGNTTQCYWVAPYVIHPTDPKTLYFGAKDIYRTTNRFNTWTNYSNNLTVADNVGGGMIRSMATSDSKPDSVLYAASLVVVYRTIDAGTTWQNITGNLPVSAGCFTCSAISDIEVHPTKPNTAWVTISGYSPNNRVFKTVDGGATWTNISSNLPAVPINCIVYEKNSPDGLYIGTDIGVFYKDSLSPNWSPYMTGLPNVGIQELEIHYGTNKLRAATFGRGLWESSLFNVPTGINNAKATEGISIYPNPGKGIFTLELRDTGEKNKIEIYNEIGQKIFTEQLKAGENKIDLTQLSKGIYFSKVFSEKGEVIYAQKLIIE